ncbi:MAG TPA: hypothetical protein EYP69_03070 [Bacteroidales bacterium]|nr:hypothetical protein [Bacteroidales bacterium]
MKISGFSMARNASKLYYPIREAIESILPIVDEFVVAIGKSDPDDTTRKEIEAINDPKIKIIDTEWDIERYPNGMENAHQTDIAKSYCTGDWLFYLQADEVVHEKYLSTIKNYCQHFYNDSNVEGFIFHYRHFWGDYNHYLISHTWYKNEIRIIRNDPDIHSWISAQSFRRIPNFDGKNYRQKKNTYKLKVIQVPAEIYHYGWVRPPSLMQKKNKALDTIHKGEKLAGKLYETKQQQFDYGLLNKIPEFKETHPAVMKQRIENFYWGNELNYSSKKHPSQIKHRHEKLKYRLLTFFEEKFLGGKSINKKNYILLKKKPGTNL